MSYGILRVKDAQGNVHDIPAIKGADGDDGFDPVITITTITGGHRVTITDAEGTHYFDVMDGSGLPTVTSVDNGKFLGVVNGVWAAAELPVYDGGVE